MVARLDGYISARRSLDTTAGQEVKVTLKLSPMPPPDPPQAPPVPPLEKPPLWPVLVTGGLAVAAVAAGAGLTAAANGKASDGDALAAKLGSNYACAGAAGSNKDCAALMSSMKGRDTLTKGAFASFVIGGAFGVASAGLGAWVAARSKRATDTQPVRALPVVGPQQGGIAVQGRF